VDSLGIPQVRMTFETLLLETILQPLAGHDNPLGSYGIESFAQLLAGRLAAE
jgi:hypothetical protein